MHPPLSMFSRRVGRCGTAVVLGALVVSLLAMPAVASDDAPPTDQRSTAEGLPPEAFGTARSGDEVSIIVAFDADGPSPGAVGHDAERERAQGIERALVDLSAILAERGVEIERSSSRTAHVLVSVRVDEVAGLLDLPGVEGVMPNLQLETALDAAIAVVDAAPASAGGQTFTGSGKTVAVLDTGVESGHPFFARDGGGHRVVGEACFSEPDDCPNGETGPGAAAPLLVDGSPNHHGTHVAGIAAGSRDGTDPSHGMAPEADILAVQVFNTKSGAPVADVYDIIDGLDWVYSKRHDHAIAAVNLSLGGGSYSSDCDWVDPYAVFRGVVDDLRAAGIVTVAAAGNGGDLDGVSFPACFSSVVAVGASTNADQVASFSNIGSEVDLVVPGSQIRSSVVGGGYARFSGTSMSAPMVSGALALLRQPAPGASASRLIDATTTSYTTIDDQRSSGKATGLPRLDLSASLADLGVGSTTSQSAPSLSTSRGDLRIDVSWTAPAPANDGTLTYRLHRSTGSSCTASSSVIYRGRGTSYADKGLTHDQTYRYCAYAIEGTDNVSSRSNVRSVTATDMSAPKAPSLSGSGGDGKASLSWTKVSDPTMPVTYRLHRSTGSSCSTNSSRVYTGTSRSFTDTGLDLGRTYRYCVTATDGAGNSSPRSNVQSVTSDSLTGCHALAGDWNRSGRDGVGWWCDAKVMLRASSGKVISYNYGRAGDVPVVADWNGDGRDTVSVIRDGTWHVNNRLSGGDSERSFHYGRVTRGDVPLAGDWTRGGRDLPAIVRDREWHLRAEQSGGPADWTFIYGRLTRGDLPLWGDWNRDGRDTVGVVREGTWHLRNSHAGGNSDISFVYGRVLAGDVPVVGDWTGDGIDTPGIVRDGQWYLRYRNAGGAADHVITF